MPQVIQIRRRNPYAEAGQGFQNMVDTLIRGTLAMNQQQDNQAWKMLGFGMQEKRMANQNARDDKRWAEQQAMQERSFAQQDKWKAEELALRKQEIGRMIEGMSKPHLVTTKDDYGNDVPMWVRPGQAQGVRIGGSPSGGVSNDALQAALADMGALPKLPSLDSGAQGPHMSLSPPASLSMAAPQDEQAMPATPQAAAQLAPVDQDQMLRGFLKKEQQTAQQNAFTDQQWAYNALKQRGDTLPPEWDQKYDEGAAFVAGQPMQPQQAQAMSPGVILDGNMNNVASQIDPSRVRWGEQRKQHIGGKEYYGQYGQSPAGQVFRVGGEVPMSMADRKDLQAIEKNDKAEKATVHGGMTIADAAIRSADESLRLLDKYGGMATGAVAQSWLGEKTWGRSLGLGQGMADLHRALQPMQTATMLEMIKEMKNQSPSGALNMRITQLEAVMLSGILGSLEIDQSPEQLKKNIVAHKEIYQQTMNALQDLAKEKGHPTPGHIGKMSQPSGGNVIRYDEQGRRLQ